MYMPRLLIIDITPLSGSAATSNLKRAYFDDWSEGRLLQINDAGEGHLVLQNQHNSNPRVCLAEELNATKVIEAFKPDLILYRPVSDSPALHAKAMEILRASKTPFFIWLMDDWPMRLAQSDPELSQEMDKDLRFLLSESHFNLAISKAMADVFGKRYKTEFDVLHNGIKPEDWIKFHKAPKVITAKSQTVVRYAGSLAPDMTQQAVFQIAKAVSELAAAGHNICFEGRTHPHWLKISGKQFNALKAVSMKLSNMSDIEYRQWLCEGDVNVIGYNFDDESAQYMQFSFANKVPELLASKVPIFVYGPKSYNTIQLLDETNACVLVSQENGDLLKESLLGLCQDQSRQSQLATAGFERAVEQFNLNQYKKTLLKRLSQFVKSIDLSIEEVAGTKTQLEECQIVYHLLKARSQTGVMVDVGAHSGGSLEPFARAGWKIWAFEPDPENRRQLTCNTKNYPNVHISSDAVSHECAQNIPFYASDVSTGISTLSPFHSSHKQRTTVNVTTLDTLIKDQKIESIDFLKIDTEGFELDVLNGLNFEHIAPKAIVAEFEDRKTKERGFTMQSLVNFFEDRGYFVLVSEWHPIEKYGITHSWRNIKKLPYSPPENAWGNLIALKNCPTDEELRYAVSACISGGEMGLDARQSVSEILGPPKPRTFYRRVVDQLVHRFPVIMKIATQVFRAIKAPKK